MSRAVAWFVHLAALAVGGTGLVYAWMRYLCESTDEFAFGNHPLEPATKAWHIVAAPLLVFGTGLLWRAHVWARIRSGFAARRRSGIALALLIGPMTLSGYLLQTAVDETWRELWVWIHAGTGGVWALGYAAHQFVRRPGPAAAGRVPG